MQKYIGSDVTSMVTLPVIIFEPMTMLQKMAEVSFALLERKTVHDKQMTLSLLKSYVYFCTKQYGPTIGALFTIQL